MSNMEEEDEHVDLDYTDNTPERLYLGEANQRHPSLRAPNRDALALIDREYGSSEMSQGDTTDQDARPHLGSETGENSDDNGPTCGDPTDSKTWTAQQRDLYWGDPPDPAAALLEKLPVENLHQRLAGLPTGLRAQLTDMPQDTREEARRKKDNRDILVDHLMAENMPLWEPHEMYTLTTEQFLLRYLQRRLVLVPPGTDKRFTITRYSSFIRSFLLNLRGERFLHESLLETADKCEVHDLCVNPGESPVHIMTSAIHKVFSNLIGTNPGSEKEDHKSWEAVWRTSIWSHQCRFLFSSLQAAVKHLLTLIAGNEPTSLLNTKGKKKHYRALDDPSKPMPDDVHDRGRTIPAPVPATNGDPGSSPGLRRLRTSRFAAASDHGGLDQRKIRSRCRLLLVVPLCSDRAQSVRRKGCQEERLAKALDASDEKTGVTLHNCRQQRLQGRR